jgi:hypothetical protein
VIEATTAESAKRKFSANRMGASSVKAASPTARVQRQQAWFVLNRRERDHGGEMILEL